MFDRENTILKNTRIRERVAGFSVFINEGLIGTRIFWEPNRHYCCKKEDFMDSERLFEAIGGGGTDPELLARADKDVSSAGAYSKGRKQRLMRCAKYFFVATVCLLLFVAIAKWVN